MKTTVQVEKTTLEKLKHIKLTKRESYDEIIVRLINNLSEENEQIQNSNREPR